MRKTLITLATVAAAGTVLAGCGQTEATAARPAQASPAAQAPAPTPGHIYGPFPIGPSWSRGLPPCPTKVSLGPCYWDAKANHDTGGRSYVVDGRQKVTFIDSSPAPTTASNPAGVRDPDLTRSGRWR